MSSHPQVLLLGNGINRTYADADIPQDMLSEIVPYCGVIGSEGT